MPAPCPQGQVRSTRTKKCVTYVPGRVTATGIECLPNQRVNPITKRCKNFQDFTERELESYNRDFGSTPPRRLSIIPRVVEEEVDPNPPRVANPPIVLNQAQLRECQNTIVSLKTDVLQLNGRIDELNGRIENSNSEISSRDETIDELNGRIEDCNSADEKLLNLIGTFLNLISKKTVHDTIMLEDVEVGKYLSDDTDNIVLVLGNHVYGVNRGYIDMDDTFLECNSTNNSIRQESANIYDGELLNLRKIGGYGFVEKEDLETITSDKNIFVLTKVKQMKSVINKKLYENPWTTNAVSAMHCQPGNESTRYKISISLSF